MAVSYRGPLDGSGVQRREIGIARELLSDQEDRGQGRNL